MIMNISRLEKKEEFYRLIDWIRDCLDMRILGLPNFRCYLRSDLYSPRYTANQNYLARAHMVNSHVSRRIAKKNQRHWVIEFNDLYDEAYDIEMVLYHELAHFIARKINRYCPSHGMLWAAACDAIQIQMDMDEGSLEEGTYWISQTDTFELEATFRYEGINSLEEWQSVRMFCQDRIRKAINEHSRRRHFEDLCAITARYAFPR